MTSTLSSLSRQFASDTFNLTQQLGETASVVLQASFQTQALRDASHYLSSQVFTKEMAREMGHTIFSGSVAGLGGRYALNAALRVSGNRFAAHVVSGLVMAVVSQLMDQHHLDRRVASTALAFKGSEIVGLALENALRALPLPLRFIVGRIFGGTLMTAANALQISLENTLGWSSADVAQQLTGQQLLHNIFLDTGVHVGSRVLHQGTQLAWEHSPNVVMGIAVGIEGGALRMRRSIPPSAPKRPEGIQAPASSTQFLSEVIGEQFSTRDYAKVVELNEARRQCAEGRVNLGHLRRDSVINKLQFVRHGQLMPLREAMLTPGESINLKTTRKGQTKGLEVEVVFEGQVYEGAEGMQRLSSVLQEQNIITEEFAAKLNWIGEYAAQNNGRIDLSDRTFAVAGARAEMLNVRDLLRAGADVLALEYDHRAMATLAEEAPSLGGRLLYSDAPIDLKTQTPEIAQTIRHLSETQNRKVDLLNLAYSARAEIQLAGAMMAIGDAVTPNLRSVGYLLSTSMINEVPASVGQLAQQNFANNRRWRGKLQEAVFEHEGRYFARRIYPNQGPGYGLAQLAKVWDVESMMQRDVTVSANTAPMTGTRSLLSGPNTKTRALMRGGLFGSDAIGMHVADVAFTNRLMLYAYLHDILNPNAAGAGNPQRSRNVNEAAQEVFAAQAHGRVDCNPQGANVRSLANRAFADYVLSWKGLFGARSVFGKGGMSDSHVRHAAQIKGPGRYRLVNNTSTIERILEQRAPEFALSLLIEVQNLPKKNRYLWRRLFEDWSPHDVYEMVVAENGRVLSVERTLKNGEKRVCNPASQFAEQGPVQGRFGGRKE